MGHSRGVTPLVTCLEYVGWIELRETVNNHRLARWHAGQITDGLYAKISQPARLAICFIVIITIIIIHVSRPDPNMYVMQKSIRALWVSGYIRNINPCLLPSP